MKALKLLYDLIGNQIPQYLKRDGSGYEAVKGADGAVDVNINGSLTKRYQDLGLVIDATNMAAGSVVYSSKFNDLDWVRNIITHTMGDQTMDVQVFRYPTMDIQVGYNTIKGGIGASTSAYEANLIVNAGGTTGALLGKSVKFGLKNAAAVPNTFAKLIVQLFE